MRSLENDRNVITKPADKVSSIVVIYQLAEAENQFSDSNTYKKVKEQKEQIKLVAKSNSLFEGLKKKRLITKKKRKKRKITLN